MPQGLSKEKIGVIGGSIAGLVVAIGLRRRGYDVTILERAAHSLDGRGAGIALPAALVQKCIALDLFDSDIPCLQTSSRSFLMKDSASPDNSRHICQQSLFLTPFNWMHIYANLRRRFPDKDYHSDCEVVSIKQDTKKCYVESNSRMYEFDRVIAADGVGSFIRKEIFSDISLQYAGYVAWRGIIDDPKIVTNKLFKGHVPGYVFSNGHLLFYQIPAPNYATTKRMLLNWLMYEHRKDIPIKELLTDKDGAQRNISLPPGKLSAFHIDHLHALAQQVLPAPIAKIICQTKAPFLQAIFDFQAPSYVQGKICLLGDAACVLRPHSVSGVLRAIEGGLSLVEAMDPSPRVDREASLLEWSNTQVALAEKQSALAKLMGQALVTEPPFWEKMDQDSTNQWWNNLMAGKKWYATSTESSETDISILHKQNQFILNDSHKVEKLGVDPQTTQREQGRPAVSKMSKL